MEQEPTPQHKTKLKELSLELPKEYQIVHCPSCNSEVLAANMNIHDKIGKCGQCNVLFPLQDHIDSLVYQKEKDTPKQTILRPEGIDIFRYRDDLEFTVTTPFQAMEGVVLFLFLFLSIGLTILTFSKDIPLPFSIISWGLTIFMLIASIFRQKIRLTLDNQSLSIRHRPKYFLKDKSYPIRDIDQVYVKKMEGSDSMCMVYLIVNTPNGQKHIKFVRYLYSYSKAKYLEQEIENHLGIIDRDVLEAS